MTQLTTTTQRPVAIDDLDRAIVNLAAKINASTYELLVLIREFDERAGWLKWGCENCTQWLHWRCDLSRSAAREKVRVAHALKALSRISDAFSKGTLSYSKVRALTRVATPDNEASLLGFALSTTATRVEERCQQLRNATPDAVEAANRAHARRALRAWRDTARGTMTLSVELPLEAGELVCRALDKAVEVGAHQGLEFEGDAWSAQQADALVTMAKTYLSGGADGAASTADHYQVVVHVDAHHVRHWAAGGETSLENTMLLCSVHHRLVHEGGYEVRKDHRGQWYFRRPDGRAIPPQGYRPDEWVDECLDEDWVPGTASQGGRFRGVASWLEGLARCDGYHCAVGLRQCGPIAGPRHRETMSVVPISFTIAADT